jgi:hypothetical protein
MMTVKMMRLTLMKLSTLMAEDEPQNALKSQPQNKQAIVNHIAKYF